MSKRGRTIVSYVATVPVAALTVALAHAVEVDARIMAVPFMVAYVLLMVPWSIEGEFPWQLWRRR